MFQYFENKLNNFLYFCFRIFKESKKVKKKAVTLSSESYQIYYSHSPLAESVLNLNNTNGGNGGLTTVCFSFVNVFVYNICI